MSMSSPKIKNLSLRLTPAEFQAIEDYCNMYHRNKSEFLREFIRSLPTYQHPTIESIGGSGGGVPSGENRG